MSVKRLGLYTEVDNADVVAVAAGVAWVAAAEGVATACFPGTVSLQIGPADLLLC